MSDCTLEALPPELLHRVFALLDKGEKREQLDIMCLRETSSLLAVIGEEYIFRNIQAVFTRECLAQLISLLQRPRIGRYVKTLHYRADVQWDEYKRRKNDLAFLAHGKKPPAYFGAYQQLCDDEKDMRREQNNMRCLSAVFRRCPNLSEVTVAFDRKWWSGWQTGFPLNAFRETPGTLVDDRDTAQRQRVYRLKEFLRVASDSITTLKLQFPSPFVTESKLNRRMPDTIAFRDVLESADSWTNLQRLAIERAQLTASEFSGFVREQTPKIAQIWLKDLCLLADGSWTEFFSSWAGRVPSLEAVTLRGEFEYADKDREDFLLSCQDTKRAAVEKFLTEGGTCPELGWDEECASESEDGYGDHDTYYAEVGGYDGDSDFDYDGDWGDFVGPGF